MVYIRGTVAERIGARIVPGDNGCTEWIGSHDRGYSKFSIRSGVSVWVHRWTWEQANGPVPDGLELDHLCRNRGCVNPEHIEAVTHEVNTQRGKFLEHGSSAEFCKNGHPRTPENRVGRKERRGVSGECKVCHRDRMRRSHRAVAAQKQAS